MVQNLSVREAKLEDARAILDLHVRSIRALCLGHYSHAECRAWTKDARIETYQNAIRGCFESLYVASLDSQIIGFSALAPRELRALYLDPDFAGQGYGKQLLQNTEDIARSQRMTLLYLDASLNAVFFYQSQGYEILRPAHMELDDGTRLPSMRMKKKLVPKTSNNLPAH